MVLTCSKGYQSLISITDDGENSLSMRWVKFGSRGCMNQAAGGGGGRHSTGAAGRACVEED